MGVIDDCEVYFGARDLYSVLLVDKNVSEAQLKKAYKKASLLCHPDRVEDDMKDEATRKFQTLSKVHSILSDQEKRAVYDETGCIDEESDLGDKDWSNYWRLLFPKLTLKDIEDYMKEYKGSEEELEDLKKYYVKYEGDMNKISEAFIGYDVDEEDKYRDILKELILNEEIPSFPKFEKETKSKRDARRKKLKKEAAEAEEMQNESEDSLVIAMRKNAANRKSQFDDMMSNLEAKYCSKEGRKKKQK